jgi:lysozyme
MLNPQMAYSLDGLHLTQDFEQCRLVAYWDALANVWTIGWGHTAGVTEGMTLTQPQADALLQHDIVNASMMVNYVLLVRPTQSEFDAMVDLCFNIGGSRFAHSTMVKLWNAGEVAAAAAEFEKWCFAAGKKCAGLLRRRLAEEKEFNA